jgi:pimeloyl-ACP methyl ester carboxylesterase
MKDLSRFTLILLSALLAGCATTTARTPESTDEVPTTEIADTARPAEITAAAPGAVITDERWEEADCLFDVPEGIAVGKDLVCGYVIVPEQHANPNGPTIRLAVAILKSDGDTPVPDPFVMFTGGPGGNIFAMGPLMLSEFGAPIRADRDIVLMSERGTYGAEPFLDCPELAIVDEHFGASPEELDTLKLEAFTKCRERLVSEGINLNAYNNPERAADVPLVMEVLGYKEYNLWGVSGGGLLTQLLVRDHPDGVRTIMTDSGAFPTPHFGAMMVPLISNVSASFRLLFEECAADAACSEHYPDLECVFFDLITSLNANPAPLTIENPATGEGVEIGLTGDLAIQVLTNAFGGGMVAYLPKAIYEMADGDYAMISSILPSAFAGDTGIGTADGLYESVFCADVGHLTIDDFATDDAYPEIVQALKPTAQLLVIDICSLWDVESQPPGDVVVSDVPALIMEGVYDTNKPPELGAEVAKNFGTSYLAEFGGTAHVTLGPCAISMMAEFMNNPAQAPDMSCVPQATSFVTP